MIDAVGKAQSIVLLGGASDMGLAVVEEFLSRGPARVVLAARAEESLDDAEARVRAAGASDVKRVEFDAVDFDSHPAVFEKIFADGDIDIAIVAFGILGDNEAQWTNQKLAVQAAQVNFTGAVSAGVLLADYMKKQGHGQIIAFSTVAGEMVRRSNFVYGSTKAGLDGFYRMLNEALRGSGVKVLTVRPGQVRTNMTKDLDDAPLTVDKEDVAKAIAKAVDNNKSLIWVHPLFRPIMMILKHLPLPIIRKLPL
ncbi:decaprenylphospho-beta-D-erythro-pentofuranosid-2-ulose 2-reductase [Corynebacterium sp. 320]|uniref:decaprenylphospho-beta-D-erythro-pentofuranosid- 2-ulose 2-reductase n=1 Tax=Corynebacterium TaxID=1716 RepID=UPI00125CC673|nr:MULTISPECIES: decaprenylphospho-beta-D-erythro-pentofuranosid-2-ulose 2-reductase [Corynebacterium]KAB1502757.1 decaprenylphospho-beta-D-erythro-pentofuranosid-2-ulose 2-reductase [Corynebacterium sp. 320]KAB1550504.1 decaprenylphospho-beta-D-erythro-pentofuranosid-2-ulose 2-reductase [Corynebacterium sp. 319]KAB1554767.1 decaprenylphospho-beta-D-erythro-pentofuranosid-2-ulose 2-reductase [Corynebacterium sp. 321]KAB3526420.1 decaprenylphospho-beta-D-erythro-pentofuranosid-2-ulose 2-reductas